MRINLRRSILMTSLAGIVAVTLPVSADPGPHLVATSAAFAPAVLEVKQGDQVTFINSDPVLQHNFSTGVSICQDGTAVPHSCNTDVAPLSMSTIYISSEAPVTDRDSDPRHFPRFYCKFHNIWMTGVVIVNPSND